MGSASGDRGLLGWTRNGKILGWLWPGVVGAVLIYIGLLGMMLHSGDSLMDAGITPHYEYRLVTPAEANPDGQRAGSEGQRAYSHDRPGRLSVSSYTMSRPEDWGCGI
jgi:hypothetical protein